MNWFAWMSEPQAWIAFATLLALEIVLNVNNVVFISILSGKLPAHQQDSARFTGLALAVLLRIALLFSLSWIIHLEDALFTIPLPWLTDAELDAARNPLDISGRDLILLVGGLFLIGKATHEIHQKLEGEKGHASAKVYPTFTSVIVQILVLDMVFSIDSVITAVGMVDHLSMMIVAVIVAVIFMMVFAGSISAFVERHPTVKMLALSFLLLIGMSLIAESFDQHIPKGYIYAAMGFSVFVECLNLRARW